MMYKLKYLLDMLLVKLYPCHIVMALLFPVALVFSLLTYFHSHHIPRVQVAYVDNKNIIEDKEDKKSCIIENTVSAVSTLSSITRAPVLSQQEAVETVSFSTVEGPGQPSSAVMQESATPQKPVIKKEKTVVRPKKEFLSRKAKTIKNTPAPKRATRAVKKVIATVRSVPVSSLLNPSVVSATSLWTGPISMHRKHTNVFKNNIYGQHIPFKANNLFKKEIVFSTSYGNTLLHSAAACGDKTTVWESLYNGMDVDVVSSSGYTPLHLAVKNGHLPIVQLLLIKGASLHARSKEGLSVLDLAIAYDQAAIIDYLFKHYTNKVLGYHDKGYSILHVAARYDAQNIIELLLLNHSFSVDDPSRLGQTPLHIAAKYGKLKALKTLIFFNAAINAQSSEGYTPLHLAIQCDQFAIAEALLSKCAHIHIETDKKETPLLLAERLGRKEIIALLKQKRYE